MQAYIKVEKLEMLSITKIELNLSVNQCQATPVLSELIAWYTILLLQQRLKKKTDILENYYWKWGLEINIKGPNVIIFNEHWAIIIKFELRFHHKVLEITRD